MTFATRMAVLAMAVASVGAMGGCEKSRDEMRPDMDKVVSGEQGLQSRDLREMTDKMAPDVLAIPEIAGNPNRIVVVMKPIQNKLETDPTRDLTIYVARLKTLLNGKVGRASIAFKEDQATLGRLQAEELGGGNHDPFEDASRVGGAPPPPPGPTTQYILWGTFYEKREAKTSYYLCTFRLTDLHTGVQIWENSYEVRTLN